MTEFLRPSHWTHNRDHFYKYVSRSAARAIFSNCTLRWSAPKLFNDPFDIQFDPPVVYNLTSLKKKQLSQLWTAFYGEDEIPAGNFLGRAISTFKSQFPKLSHEEFDAEFGASFDESIEKLESRLPETYADLRRHMAEVKVLCLSEIRDNLLMWSHYAEQHKGLVLEFVCIPELDSAWGAAEPVQYQNAMPVFLDEDFLARMGSGQCSIDNEQLFRKLVYSKAKDWAYEKEWRIVGGRSGANQDSEDIPFSSTELSSVYLGCQMPDTDRLDFSAIVAQRFLHAKIFQAYKKEREFGIKFEEIVTFTGEACSA